MLPEQKSNASWLASEDRQTQDALLGGLKDEAILALPWLWRFWAFPRTSCRQWGIGAAGS